MIMQETVNQRFKELVKRKTFGNVKLFAVEAGISPNTAASIASGQTESIRTSTLEAIALKWPDINLHWLITGKGEPITSNSQQIGNITGSQNTASNHYGKSDAEILKLDREKLELERKNWELHKKLDELHKKLDELHKKLDELQKKSYNLDEVLTISI